jgi:transcriptional regulator with XRE-family HTH domain
MTDVTEAHRDVAGWIVNELVQRRRAKGLTQSEVAHDLGIHQSTLSKWENRITEPFLSQLCLWLHALDLKLVLADRRRISDDAVDV